MYQKSILPNGIRVLSECLPYVKSVTVGVWLGSGSRSEESYNHGISHFIEHLMFKGTEKRSAKDIAEIVDAVGGQLNAFTAKEHTCFYMKVLDTHLELAIDVISDMLLNSKFSDQDIEREREVILEELSMYEDTPDELIHDLHMEEVWPGHQLGQSIIGTADSIQKIDRSAILDYYNRFYTPDNLVIAAAGNVKHDHLVSLAEQYFGKLSGSKYKIKVNSPVFTLSNKIHQKATEQVHLCLGTDGINQESPDIYAFHIVNNLLGGGISSRLFQSIREEKGLAYSVYSYQTNYSDGGLLTIYAGTRPSNVEQVLHLILNTITDLKTNGLTEAELTRVKEQLKGSLLLGLESSSSRMSRIGKMEIALGKYVPLDEVVAKIDQTTRTDVATVIDNIFNENHRCLTTLGPVDKIVTPINF